MPPDFATFSCVLSLVGLAEPVETSIFDRSAVVVDLRVLWWFAFSPCIFSALSCVCGVCNYLNLWVEISSERVRASSIELFCGCGAVVSRYS